MSNPKPINHSDLQKFFKDFYNVDCRISSNMITPPYSEYEYGEANYQEAPTVNVLTCNTPVKNLSSFTLHIFEKPYDATAYDILCKRLDSGALECYADANDFSFVLERQQDGLKISGGHYVSYLNEWTDRISALNGFIRSVSFGEFWVPASW